MTDWYFRAFPVSNTREIDWDEEFMSHDEIESQINTTLKQPGDFILLRQTSYNILDMARDNKDALVAYLITPSISPVEWSEKVSDRFHNHVRRDWGIVTE